MEAKFQLQAKFDFWDGLAGAAVQLSTPEQINQARDLLCMIGCLNKTGAYMLLCSSTSDGQSRLINKKST